MPTEFDIDAEGAMLINTDTEDIVYSKNIHTKLYPASLTKLMTALVFYEHVTDLDGEIVTVSENALKLLQGTDSSVGGLKAGEKLTARQMLYVLLLSSANDGANAIAEHIGGNIATFVDMMNEKAQQLGMVGTHFKNAHGLHHVDHYTTVNDIYILSKAFLNIDVLKEIGYTTKYKLDATNMSKARTFTTTNFLLLNNGQKCTDERYKNQPYYYKYARGLKTGYTDPAGRCLVSTASKNGYNYMCIIMNSPAYNSKNEKIRLEFGATKALYEWAFNDFEYKTVINGGSVVTEVPVDLAWDTDYVAVCTSEALSAIVPKVSDASTVSYNAHMYKEKYDAPIKQGDVLGECDIVYAGEVLGTVPLIAAQDVKRSNVMYIGRGIRNFTQSVFSSPAFLVVFGIVIVSLVVFIIVCVVINSPKHKKRRY